MATFNIRKLSSGDIFAFNPTTNVLYVISSKAGINDLESLNSEETLKELTSNNLAKFYPNNELLGLQQIMSKISVLGPS